MITVNVWVFYVLVLIAFMFLAVIFLVIFYLLGIRNDVLRQRFYSETIDELDFYGFLKESYYANDSGNSDQSKPQNKEGI